MDCSFYYGLRLAVMGYMGSLFRSWLFTKHDEYHKINLRMGKSRRHGKIKRLPKEIMCVENDSGYE